MKRISLFLSFLVYCIIAQSQLQFAGSFGVSPTNGGAVFGIRSTGVTTTLHNFVVTDPKSSTGFPLVEGPDGRIYGVTDAGGVNHKGVVYAMNVDGSGFTILYTCPTGGSISETKPAFGPDGKLYTIISGMLCNMNLDGSAFSSIVAVPNSYSLQIDSDGWVYSIGTSGSQNFIYKVKTDGTGYNVLHTLVPATEGTSYTKGLTLTPTGRLYGVNSAGGSNSGGTLFSIRTDGTGFTVHKVFGGSYPNDGTNPYCLLLHKDGKIFGTTLYGGTNNGVIFSFDTTSLSYTVIYNSTKGSTCGLTAGTDGKLYSVTASGAAIYRIDPDGQNYEEIYSTLPNGGGGPSINDELVYHTATNRIVTVSPTLFYFDGGSAISMDNTGQNAVTIHNYGYAPGGNYPGALIKDGSNKLYGVTVNGGIQGAGIIFSMNYDGSGYTKLYDYPQGSPSGKMLLASDGKLYGLYTNVPLGTVNGGIYRINTDGSNFEVVKQFSPLTEGTVTTGHLAEDPSGELYGLMNAASSGGACVYKIQKDGTGFTILRNFTLSEGRNPQDGLIITGGYLYGTCGYGGNASSGTAFRIALDGTGFQVLRHFNQSNNDGYGPLCGLTTASNGKIYGVNSFGGIDPFAAGTIFSMNPDGSGFIVLYNFSWGTTGSLVQGRLIEGSDGKLYGTTTSSGLSGMGTFFSINPDGTGFTALKHFDGAAGRTIIEELVEIPLLSLPVKLNYFIAGERDAIVKLSWATSEEENSDKFIIERSIDGLSFIPIETVHAVGNASSLTSYSTEDLHPVKGKNYYRLKMTDKDGSFKYSLIRLIDLTKKNEALRIYPNPSHGELTVESNFRGRKLTITITDLSGKTASKYTLANSHIISLDVTALAKGMYTLSIDDGSMIRSQLFVKE